MPTKAKRKSEKKEHEEVFAFLLYQQKWIANTSPVKVWEKSRRIGASWCEAADNVLIASRRNNPQNVFYITASKDMAVEYINDAANWARIFNEAAEEVEEFIFTEGSKDKGDYREIQAYRIKFASGKRIEALSSRPSNLRGKQGVVVIDEAAFQPDLKGLIKAAMALLMWGGEVRILSTHNGEDNEFNTIVKDIRAGRLDYYLHRTTLDDALADGLYKRICYCTGQEWSLQEQDKWREDLINFYRDGYLEELFCVPANSSGAYFPRILVENAMDKNIDVLNLSLSDEFFSLQEQEKQTEVISWCSLNLGGKINKLNPHYRTSLGSDFGRKGDLSYFVLFQELPNLVRKAAFALEMRNVPFTQQEQILFWIIDKCPRFIGGAFDAVGNGASLAEKAASRYGQYRIFQVNLSIPWYRENMPKYKAALEDHKVLLPNNSDLLNDHRAVEVIKGIPKLNETRQKGTDGKQRHGDGAIACALAWFASLNDCENVYVERGSHFSSIWA